MIRLRIQKSASEEDARNFDGGVCETISAPLFMRGETTHHSFFTTFSDDKNRNLCGFSAEKRE